MSDCISRGEVIYNLANIARMKARSDAQKSLMGRCIFMIENMPSVEPERPHGEWIITSPEPGYIEVRCSVCNHTHMTNHTYDFCPVCGADMRGDNNADN